MERPLRPYCLARTTMLRPSGVSSASEASCAASASSSTCTPGAGMKFRCLAVAESDGAGLVEQQHIHVPGRLDGPAAHGEHVLLNQPVDACNPDGAQQPADGRWNKANQQGHEHSDRKGTVRNKGRRA